MAVDEAHNAWHGNFTVLCALKLRFEPILSHVLFQGSAPVDTLQICAKLVQGSLQCSTEIQHIFTWHADSEKAVRQKGEEEYTAGDLSLFKFIHQHAERISELRSLIAHNLLSITPNECSSVLESIVAILGAVRLPLLPKQLQASSYDTLSSDSSPVITQDIASRFSSWRLSKSEEYRLPLESSEAKLYITMQLMMTLEETVVRLFSQQGDKLPAQVSCVSSLCSCLRNEFYHADIQRVLGASLNLKALILKNFASVENAEAVGKGRLTPVSKKGFSHLDHLYIARNKFNHASFQHVSLHEVCQWIESGTIMLKIFNAAAENAFEGAISRLSLLTTVLASPDQVIKVRVSKGQPQGQCQRAGFNVSGAEYLRVTGGKPTAGAQVVVRLLKKPPSRCFVGRQRVLNLIAQTATTVNSADPRVIVLSGYPGMGKSYVALQAAQQPAMESSFQIFYWLSATTTALLKGGLVGLINATKALGADIKTPINKLLLDLSTLSRQFSFFLVFDDVTQSTMDVVRELLASLDPQNVFSIVTTCVKGLPVCPNCEEVEIKPLSLQECFDVLKIIVLGVTLPRAVGVGARKMRQNLWEEILANKPALEPILVKALGCSPHGVSLLGQLFVSEMSFQPVVDKFWQFSQDKEELSGSTKKPLLAHQHSGLEITVRNLLNPYPNEKSLLNLLYAASILSPNGIPLRLLCNLDSVSSTSSRSEPSSSFIDNELTAMEATGLVQRTLVKQTQNRDEETEDKGIIYVLMHQLTQRALRHVLPAFYGVEPLRVCQRLVQGVRKDQRLDQIITVSLGSYLVDPDEAAKWAECIFNSPMTRQIFQYCFDGPLGKDSLLKDAKVSTEARKELLDVLLQSSGLLLDLTAERTKAINRRLKSLHLNGSSEEIEREMNVLRDLLLAWKPFQEDLIQHEAEKEIGDMLEPEKEPVNDVTFDQTWFEKFFHLCVRQGLTVEHVCFILSRVLASEGNGKGLQTMVSLLESFLQTHFHPETVLTNLLAVLKSKKAWFMSNAEGEQEIDSALASLCPNNNFFASAQKICLYTKANFSYGACNHNKAIALFRQVAEDCKHSDLNFETLRSQSLNATAVVMIDCGRLAEARPILEEVHTVWENVYRNNKYHWTLAASHSSLGLCCLKLHLFEKAEQHFFAYEVIRRKVNRNDDLVPMWNITNLYSWWGKYSKALEWTLRRWQVASDIKLGFWVYCFARVYFLHHHLALGPKVALPAVVEERILEDPELLPSLQKSVPIMPKAPMTVLVSCSRVLSWQGKHQDAWEMTLRALEIDSAHRGQPSMTMALDDLWKVRTQLLTAAVLLSRHCSTPLLSLLAPSNSIEVEHKGSDCKPPTLEVLQDSWRICIRDALEIFGDTYHGDTGWRFEFARLLLWISEDKDLLYLLDPSSSESPSVEIGIATTNQRLRLEGKHALKCIVEADVEETEWTEMAKSLLAAISR